jgi:hypothetical protein
MTTTPVRENDSLPIVVGYLYKIGNSTAGGGWVEVTAISNGKVTLRGVGNNIADIVIPSWKFDDVMSGEYIEAGGG